MISPQGLHQERALPSTITSAGRGIARAIALAYAQAGAAVVCSARTTQEIQKTVSLIEASGGQAIAQNFSLMRRAA